MKKIIATGLMAVGVTLGASGGVAANGCEDSSATGSTGCVTEVKPVVVEGNAPTPTASPSVKAPTPAAATPAVKAKVQLPVTGSEATYLALAGVALVSTGLLMTRRSEDLAAE